MSFTQYQYAVCYENVNEPGYVTEKVPHARIAGCHTMGVYYYDFAPELHSNERFAAQVLELLE